MSGTVDYVDAAFNDGTLFGVTAGVGKKFYPKNSLEFRLSFRDQEHDTDSFTGVLYSLRLVHVTESRKGSLNLVLEKDVKPSATVGSDFTEVEYLRFTTHHLVTRHVALASQVRLEHDLTGDRNDRYILIDLRGEYTPRDTPPLKPERPWKYNWRIDFGAATRARTSDVDTYDFNQTRIFAGMKIVY